MNKDIVDIKLESLAKSKFRASFRLSKKMFEYIDKKGLDVIRKHAYEIIDKRLRPSYIENDGRQTPMKNHPVFIAQHACACCCRGCLEKWHHIPKNQELTLKEIDYIVDIIMEWIIRQCNARGEHYG